MNVNLPFPPTKPTAHPLQVYYLPRLPFYQQSSFPSLLGWARLLRAICMRERATLLHGHQVRRRGLDVWEGESSRM